MEIKVDTKYNSNTILQGTYFEDEATKRRQEISSRTIMLEEDGIKNALIKLGWMPPDATCENCKWYTQDNGIRGYDECRKGIASVVQRLDDSVNRIIYKDFGCNKFERKD